MADLSGIWLWSMAALWLLVLVEAFLTFAVLRQLGLVSARLPEPRPRGLPAGTPAPAFTLVRPDGTERTLADLLETGLLLAFVSPSCSACKTFVPVLNDFVRALPSQASRPPAVAAVCTAAVDDCRHYTRDQPIVPEVLCDPGRATFSAYQLPGVPHVVAIDRAGVVRESAFVHDLAGLQRLAGLAAAEPAAPARPVAAGQWHGAGTTVA